MLEQSLTNLSLSGDFKHTKTIYKKLHKRAGMLQWILGRFIVLQNEFEMRLAKKPIN